MRVPADDVVPRVRPGDLPRLATGLAMEAAWVTAHLAMYPLGLLAATPVRATRRHDLRGLSPHQRGLVHYAVDAAATPILLVHGIVDNHSIFTVMERALRRRGFTDLSSFDYGLLTRDLRRAAADLGVAVERLVEESGYDRVHVVGHSLGGLISRYYVQRLGGHHRVDTLVTLGTPHSGTRLARAGRGLPLIGQLTPESEVIGELAAPAPGCRTRFVAFYSDLDQLIVPTSHARLEHPDLQVRNVAVRGLGHLSMPNSPAIAFRIAAVLAGVDPETGTGPAAPAAGAGPDPGDGSAASVPPDP